MNCLRPIVPILALVAYLLQAGPLFAATVAIVQPTRSTPEIAITLSRLHGELASIGLAVIPADALPGHPTTAATAEADAVVAMAGDSPSLAVEVWFAKPPTGQPQIARITVDANTKDAPGTLALRTVELLRANLLEVGWAGRTDTPPAPPSPSSPPPQRKAETASAPRSLLGLEAGAAVLGSLDGIGPALLPTVHAGWVVRPTLILHATVAGFGTRPTVANTLGSARVSQHYGLVGAAYRFRAGMGPLPFLSLAVGALRTGVVGRAISSAIEGDQGSQWSFLLDSGVGIEMPLWGSLHATIGAHVQLAMPHVAIHFMDVAAATTGRPNLLFDLTLGFWR